MQYQNEKYLCTYIYIRVSKLRDTYLTSVSYENIETVENIKWTIVSFNTESKSS